MNSETQDMKFRQSLLKYSQKYGVTKAAIKYKTYRNIFTVGCGGTTVRLNRCVRNPADRTIIQINTPSKS